MTALLTTSTFSELPLAFGLLKLSTASDVSEEEAEALIHFALANGIRVFDTADCYFRSHDNPRFGEQLLRNALKSWPGDAGEVIVMTKAGLTRKDGKWIPNGRPEHIRETAELSRQALGVGQIPVLQLHVRDPEVPFRETLEALRELQSEGIVNQLGLCNTTPAAVVQAEDVFDVAVIQNELSAWRFGQAQRDIVAAAAERNIPLFAYRPLNDGKHSRRAAATKRMDRLADSHEITRSEAALAWLRSSGNHVIPLFGATRMTSIKSSCAALKMELPQPEESAAVPKKKQDSTPSVLPKDDPDILIVMGIQGSGKSEFVAPFVNAGYQRLNRDLLGGTLKDLIPRLDRMLAGGKSRVVLDNTYCNRAAREAVVASGKKYRVPVRCMHIRTPLVEAQKNVVLRMVSKYGMPLGPVEMEMMRKADPNLPPPQALSRWLQTYETPVAAEGFKEVIELPFERRFNEGHTNKGLFLDVDGTLRRTLSGNVFPHHPDDVELLENRREVLRAYLDDDYQLFFVSNQGGIAAGMVTHDAVQAAMYRTVELLDLPVTEITYCSHPTRPIGCFCRKPLPGLGVYLMERHQLDPNECIMVGDMDSDREFAVGLGVQFHWANDFFR